MIEVREAKIEDIQAIRTYLNELRNEHLPTIYTFPDEVSEERATNFVTKLIDTDNSALFIAVKDGLILGTLDFHGSHRIQQRHCGVFAVSVAFPRRGQGIGSKLILNMLDWDSKNNITRVELETFATNVNAIKLYEKLGFVREGVHKGAVIVGEIPIDIICMARRTDA